MSLQRLNPAVFAPRIPTLLDGVIAYGYLYNGHVVTDDKSIAMDGWKIPTESDVQEFMSYIDTSNFPNIVGRVLKDKDNTYWNSPGIDTYGFGLRGSGNRKNDGVFEYLKDRGHFWTSTPSGANLKVVYAFSGANTLYIDPYSKLHGVPIRLVKVNPTIDELALNDGQEGLPYYDYEGTEYKTVKIGSQVWLKKNLVTRYFKDGTEIAYIFNPTTNGWSITNYPALCAYDNDMLKVFTDVIIPEFERGYLYNGYCAANNDIANNGWEIARSEANEILSDVIPQGTPNYIRWNDDGIHLAYCSANKLEIYAYNDEKEELTITFTLSMAVNIIKWMGDYLIVGKSTGTRLEVYLLDGGSLTSVATPDVNPASAVNWIDTYKDYILVCINSTTDSIQAFQFVESPYALIKRINNNPGTVAANTCYVFKEYLVVGLNASPFITLYDLSEVQEHRRISKISDGVNFNSAVKVITEIGGSFLIAGGRTTGMATGKIVSDVLTNDSTIRYTGAQAHSRELSTFDNITYYTYGSASERVLSISYDPVTDWWRSNYNMNDRNNGLTARSVAPFKNVLAIAYSNLDDRRLQVVKLNKLSYGFVLSAAIKGQQNWIKLIDTARGWSNWNPDAENLYGFNAEACGVIRSVGTVLNTTLGFYNFINGDIPYPSNLAFIHTVVNMTTETYGNMGLNTGAGIRLVKSNTVLKGNQKGFYIGNDRKVYPTLAFAINSHCSVEIILHNLIETRLSNQVEIPLIGTVNDFINMIDVARINIP